MEYGRPVLWLFWSGLETVNQATASGAGPWILAFFDAAGPWIIAFFLAWLFALAELLSRHSMEIRILVKVPSVWAYLVLNGASAVAALLLLREMGLFSPSEIAQGFGAGIGAVIFLRSSLHLSITGEESKDFGFFQVTKIFLDLAERGVVRGAGTRLSVDVEKIMKNVDFNKAMSNLPILCLDLIRTDVPMYEKGLQLGDEIAKIRADSSMDEHAKTLWLGRQIGRLTGTDLLAAVVKQLGDRITTNKEKAGQ